MAEQKESPERELLLGFIFDSQGYLDHWPLGCKDNQINIKTYSGDEYRLTAEQLPKKDSWEVWENRS